MSGLLQAPPAVVLTAQEASVVRWVLERTLLGLEPTELLPGQLWYVPRENMPIALTKEDMASLQETVKKLSNS